MLQYKLTYHVRLSNPSGPFGATCMTPLAIMEQMEKAQTAALQKIDTFLKIGDNAQKCSDVTPINGQLIILITCAPELLRGIARLPGITVHGEYKPEIKTNTPPKPPGFKPRP